MSPEPPRRVRVTGPRTGAVRRRVAGTSEIDAQTQVGEIYMSSLLRAQLRLASLILLGLAVLCRRTPRRLPAHAAADGDQRARDAAPWVLLAFAVYPFLFLLGWLYVRASERTERDFTDVVERR